ncbi:MAG TPA: restriction endonuclease [Rhizomicrobium sp.]|jgi:restriction system protein|nr:restriction endonuclease [Rhizomicrobium sp.]
MLRQTHPSESEGTLKNCEAQLWAFAKRIEIGDLVALPRKLTSTIAFGRVTGPYKYADGAPAGATHQRPVEWITTDLPRQRVDQDLLYSLGSAMTVFQVSRNNAEERLRRLLHVTGNPPPAQIESEADSSLEASSSIDVERIAQDEILQRIDARFRGHALERLVDAVLTAQGFTTQRAPEGADGGVDIVGGKGPLGLEPPRICVQVKSSDDPADVSVLREMQGVLSTFGAELGLIVSWGGFRRSVLQESRRHFFKIRLWDAGDLVSAVLENYEKLPEDIQKDLPLKRIWVLVSDEPS